jgi:UDP-2,3-diacylglucosamine pyrophosphatase LpxH
MPESTSSAVRVVMRDDAYRKQVADALDRALRRVNDPEHGVTRPLDLATDRYIIFSDQHKGARNGADDFWRCERAYNAAMAYYYANGSTLVELGDVEELWEERPRPVLDAYQHSLMLSARFQSAGRYLRIYGNHDDAWSFRDQVQRYLADVYGKELVVYESARLRVMDGDHELGFIWLVHGHQGTTDSDRFSWLSRLVVRFFWRPVQRLFNISLNTPAKDWLLRERHNIALYNWAAAQSRLLLIAGHTHRPVFESKSRAAQIVEALKQAEAQHDRSLRDAREQQAIAELYAELEWVRAQDEGEPGIEGRVGRLVLMERPCYFNTGCCCFSDGDITGIEIADGEIRLVRWPDDAGSPRPQTLARLDLRTVFGELGQDARPVGISSPAE